MAFGVKREELMDWKKRVQSGEIAILTHFWIDDRFPGCDTVTKVGCSDIEKLRKWGAQYGLHPGWIHYDPRFPHFDLFGERQYEILKKEEKWDQIERFSLDN
ncbi:hypothetical protein LCL89_03855 [Halobacillus yeomjeoni]|uniref:Uncharacterized protein n=1 Tax=Halobacillus yeomjeoni TaxID=311194 RepID=A0A931HU36_9BACI|nr:hypothetical protein [Halobacillus yeomjeoni]MBH0229414.1 hypothetical protein [Halobacillus yeomjeoni]MCA0983181.1 hypothetical protein [Halobacillus yeomjeoni]